MVKPVYFVCPSVYMSVSNWNLLSYRLNLVRKEVFMGCTVLGLLFVLFIHNIFSYDAAFNPSQRRRLQWFLGTWRERENSYLASLVEVFMLKLSMINPKPGQLHWHTPASWFTRTHRDNAIISINKGPPWNEVKSVHCLVEAAARRRVSVRAWPLDVSICQHCFKTEAVGGLTVVMCGCMYVCCLSSRRHVLVERASGSE